MKVTIAITTYNRPEMLRRSVTSAIGQTYKDIEILVCDDASSYDLSDILSEFDDPRIRLVRAVENGGIVANRNRALESATGQLFAFLDDDDVMLPHAIEALVASYERHGHVGVHYGALYVLRNDALSVKPARGLAEREAYGDYVFRKDGFIHLSSCLFSTALGREVQFCLALKRHEDHFFLLQMIERAGRSCFIPTPLTVLDLRAASGRYRRSGRFEETLAAAGIIGPKLSPKARKAFMARLAAPKLAVSGQRLRASALLLDAIAGGCISWRTAVRIAGGIVASGLKSSGEAVPALLEYSDVAAIVSRHQAS